MNTQQQAYINGFVKRASEYGLNQYEAIELLKSAAFSSSGGYDMDVVDGSYKKDNEADGEILHSLQMNQNKAPGLLNHLKRNAGKYVGAGAGLSLAAIINSQHDGYTPGTSFAATVPFLVGRKFDNARDENFLDKEMHKPENLDKILGYIHKHQK